MPREPATNWARFPCGQQTKRSPVLMFQRLGLQPLMQPEQVIGSDGLVWVTFTTRLADPWAVSWKRLDHRESPLVGVVWVVEKTSMRLPGLPVTWHHLEMKLHSSGDRAGRLNMSGTITIRHLWFSAPFLLHLPTFLPKQYMLSMTLNFTMDNIVNNSP